VTAVESLASSETTAKDDDVSSLQNASSESASNWENKSQASTSVDKSSDAGERRPAKGKGKNVEKAPIKPLQEAPIPAVNPWIRRSHEMQAKAAQKATPKSATNATTGVTANGTAQPSPSPVKKANGPMATDAAPPVEKGSAIESKSRTVDDEKAIASRKDVRLEGDSDRAKKGGRSRPLEKDSKPTATALPLLPDRDQESWPTPENAVGEDRKKAQVKGDKPDAERKETSSSRPHGKKEWVPVPHTPSVVFNSLPHNTMGSRRGGRSGGRGGAQSSGRGGSFAANSDKDAPALSTMSNGDASKRGRPESAIGRDVSPKEERASSVGGAAQIVAKIPMPSGEKNAKGTNGSENEGPKAAALATDANPSSQIQGHSNAFPRQHPQTRPSKGRRGDFVPQGEKRKDGESISPAKDSFPSHGGRPSTAVDANGKPLNSKEATVTHGFHAFHDTDLS
jgi:la-related protein 1